MSASSQLRRLCKTINAAVRRCIWSPSHDFGYSSIIGRTHRRIAIYIDLAAAYIDLRNSHPRALFGQPRPQSPAAQANRRLEPPSGAGSRSLVPGRRILRRSRFGASEVRDAAPCAHRRGRQNASGCTLRRIAADVLSSRSGLRTRGLKRTTPQATRPQRRAQAHARSDAVCRASHRWGGPSGRPSTRQDDPDRVGCVGSSSQHRTRSGAQKKTVASGHGLPLAAVPLYEKLREEVLQGVARPDGLGAFIYHGMLDGLTLLMSATAITATHQLLHPEAKARDDRELVSLLANMILRAHSEVKHVY